MKSSWVPWAVVLERQWKMTDPFKNDKLLERFVSVVRKVSNICLKIGLSLVLTKAMHFCKLWFMLVWSKFNDTEEVSQSVIKNLKSIRQCRGVIKSEANSLPKIRYTVCQLSGVSTRCQVLYPSAFYLSRPCFHVAPRNAHANGANFVLNRQKNM